MFYLGQIRKEAEKMQNEIKDSNYRHHHEEIPIIDLANEWENRKSFGNKIADGFAKAVGSWSFIIGQSIILIIWIILNITAYIKHWDPYPFILLNLALSFQAAYAAPIIMMSQNRQAAKDRMVANNDYEVDRKTVKEIYNIHAHLHENETVLKEILLRLNKLESKNE